MKTNNSIIKSIVRLISVVLPMIVGIGNMWGTDVTWDYSSDAISNVTKGQITVTYAQNNGTNAVAISSNLLRLYRQSASPYNGCTAKWTAASGYQITAIQVVFDGGRTAARGKIDNGNYADVFSGGNSKTITISSLTATSYTIQNQASGSTTVTISSVKITYEATCDKSVTVSNGGSSTNGSITSIETSPVATCSATAADRHVSIVVTPSTGYVAPTDLTVASSTGTVNASKISRTDNGNGTFTFVYQFAQNDNGTITYNAACVGNQYSVTFDKQSGSGGSDEVTATYDDEMPSATMPTRNGYNFEGYFTETGGAGTQYYNADGSSANDWNEAANTTLYAYWTAKSYTDYRFSCAELTLTKPDAGDLVFITSAASKTVRSQERFHIEGNGLTPSTAVTFTISPSTASSKFAFKKADGTTLSTDASGEIDTDFYVYYTPGAGDTSDGLDQFTTLTASVADAKPKTASLAGKTVIGRHLPANFVIAAKVDGRWYALPANKSSNNLTGIAIRVDDNTNPTTAYCVNTNSFTLYQDNTANSEKVIVGLTNYKKNGVSYALFGADATSTKIGYSTGLVNGDLGDKYKWTLTQTATSVSAVSDAKYVICRAGKADSLSLRTSTTSATWGTYVYAANSSSRKTITELRLLTLSEVGALSLTVMEWGTDAIAVSYPNGGSASSVQAIVNGGSPAAVTLTSLGGDMYKISTISGLTTTSNFGRSLVITATEGGVAKQIVLTIPIIVTDSKTEANLRSYMPGSTATERNAAAKLVDVVIRNGGTLTTGTGSGSFANLYIYPGGKAKIAHNFVAKGNIYTRGGYSFLDNKATYKYPDLCITAGTTTTTNLYYDLYIDNRYYYTFSMPYDVTLASVTDEAGNDDFDVWVKHYNGATRATGTHVSGWEWYGDDAETQHSFFAGVGYEITAKPKTSGRPIAIIRFPVKTGNLTTDAERSVGVAVDNYGKSAYDGGSLAANNVGWNFVGNPYLTEYKAGTASPGNASDTLMLVAQGYEQHIDPTTGAWDGTYDWKASNKRFITVPYDTQTDYHAEAVATYAIPAFSAFFIQTTESGTFYMRGTRPQAAAPARYSAMPKEKAEMQLDVLLRGNGEAVVGKAGLIIHDKYEGGLKDFEDVEQWFVDKNELKTYTFADGAALAYNLTNEEYAKQLIPMGYIATVAGEHTYSLNEENNVSGLEHLWLTDYQTGQTTDLLVRDYTFTTDAGRFDERFAISAVFNQQEVATEVTNTTGGDWMQTIGVYHDGSTLTLRGLPENSSVYVYDMTGKLMTSGEKLHQVASFSIAAQGVYNIRVVDGDKAVTLRSVIR